ncbi:MAG TPA: acylphosphatase [Gaiellaceae bacterium]|nr:acylphosphatase [Gaiellaceae bacterium]
MSEPRRVRVVVGGSVQAVGFRVSARDRASSLGVSGWVRNNADGTVEAELEGDPDRVDSLVEWFRRGPRGPRVDTIEVEPVPPTGERGFSIR